MQQDEPSACRCWGRLSKWRQTSAETHTLFAGPKMRLYAARCDCMRAATLPGMREVTGLFRCGSGRSALRLLTYVHFSTKQYTTRSSRPAGEVFDEQCRAGFGFFSCYCWFTDVQGLLLSLYLTEWFRICKQDILWDVCVCLCAIVDQVTCRWV